MSINEARGRRGRLVEIESVDSAHRQLDAAFDEDGDIADEARQHPTRRGLQPESNNADGTEQPPGCDATYGDDPHGLRPYASHPADFTNRLLPEGRVLFAENLLEAQLQDTFCAKWIAFLKGEAHPAIREREMDKLKADFSLAPEGFLRHFADSHSSGMLVPVLPLEQRRVYMQAAHDRLAHQGDSRTLRALRARAWWPAMRHDVQQFIRDCPTCAFNRVEL